MLARSCFAVIAAGTEHLGTGTSDTAWLGRVPIPTAVCCPFGYTAAAL